MCSCADEVHPANEGRTPDTHPPAIDTIMRALLLAAIAWSACDALLLGPAYATQRASAYRAHVRLDEGGAAAPTAAPSTFTADEIAALKEARCHAACVFSGLWLTYSALSRVLSAPLFPLRSVSKDTPAKDSLGPEALLNAFTQPKEYFSLLRNPNKDPPKEVLTAWACVCRCQ